MYIGNYFLPVIIARVGVDGHVTEKRQNYNTNNEFERRTEG